MDAIAFLADTWNDDLDRAEAYLPFGKDKEKVKTKEKGKGKGRYPV